MRRVLRSINFWTAVILAACPMVLPERLHGVLALGAIYSISSLGLSMLLGYADQISMSQAAFMGIGAYTTALLTTEIGCPPPVALVASAIVSAAIALVVGKPVLKTKGFFLALATLGFGEMFFSFVVRTEELIGGEQGIGGVPYFSIVGYEFGTYAHMYYLSWAILFMFLIYSQNMTNSRAGRAFRALGTDDVAASAMGIDVASYKLKLFVLAGAYGGVAGSLMSFYFTAVHPHVFGSSLSIFILLAVIMGGMASLWGTVAATVFLTWLQAEQLSRFQEYSNFLYGIIIILVVIFAPNGLRSLREKLVWGWRSSRSPKLRSVIKTRTRG